MRRRYGLAAYLAGAVAARVGDEMSGPALMLAGFAVTGSAAAGSALLAGVTISAVVGGPVLGLLLDRVERPGRLLAGALCLYGGGSGLVVLGLGRMPFAAVLGLAVVVGVAGPAVAGGWTAQLPRVAPGGVAGRANVLDAMTFGVASLAGPALAGGVAEGVGADGAVVAAGALIGVAVPVAWGLPRAPGRRAARGGFAAGVRFVLRNPALARATFTSVGCCMAQGVLTACVPLLGERVLGGAARGAVLLSCAAGAGLVANAVLARLRVAPDAVIRLGAAVQAAGLALAATGRPAALMGAALLVGAGEGPQLTALFAVRHRESPDHLRSQIFTTGASMKITAFAVGAALAGQLAEHSLPGALLLGSGVAAVVCVRATGPSTPWRLTRRGVGGA
ncbi:MFS transporter [Streptomyces sp. SID2999]|uniref:MFS transporter n=1 Tax=Streptomyces sp. SID2999 TaxID=2690258 RepID=UPI001368A487|nr:MFS transporter [Streptomyces sp. SID2999]